MADTTLHGALVKALAEMPNPKKNADNPAFKRDGRPMRYADLEATLDACQPALAKHGIAVMQHPTSDEGGVGVHTWLIGHGETLDCGTFTLPLAKRDPQGAGSAITYARRYSLTSLFGLAQADDDGNDASRRLEPVAEPVDEPKAKVTPADVRALFNDITKHASGERVVAQLIEWQMVASAEAWDELPGKEKSALLLTVTPDAWSDLVSVARTEAAA